MKGNFALRLLTKAILNTLLVWVIVTYLTAYFVVTGGWPGYIVIGALITLLNFFARPILYMIALPFKMFALALGIIVANGLFVQILYEFSSRFDSSIVTLEMRGGMFGWIVIALCFGLANWLMRVILK